MFTLQIFLLVIFTLSTPILFSVLKISKNDKDSEDWFVTAKSTEESKALLQLREICGDVMYEYDNENQFYLNWLTEYEMDVQAACKMMREARKWREGNGIDSILNETDTILTISPFLCYIGSVDDAGKIYVLCRAARIDTRKLILEGRRNDFIRAFFYWVEKGLFQSREISRKLKTPFRPGIIIMDMEGYSPKAHACIPCIGVGQEISTCAYKYYPRIADTILLINAPKFALPIMDIFKKALGPYYGRIIHAIGSNKTEISKVLLSYIPRDRLLVMYGGTKVI